MTDRRWRMDEDSMRSDDRKERERENDGLGRGCCGHFAASSLKVNL